MRALIIAAVASATLMLPAADAEAGRRGRGRFAGGFAAGAIVGALTGGAIHHFAHDPYAYGPPHRHRVRPARAWIPGHYVVRYRSCGTPYRVWSPGYWRY